MTKVKPRPFKVTKRSYERSLRRLKSLEHRLTEIEKLLNTLYPEKVRDRLPVAKTGQETLPR